MTHSYARDVACADQSHRIALMEFSVITIKNGLFMQTKRILGYIRTAIEKKAKSVHFCFKKNNKVGIFYEYFDISCSEIKQEENGKEIFETLAILSCDPNVLLKDLPKNIESIEIFVSNKTLHNSQFVVLYIFEKNDSIYTPDLNTETRLKNFGYTERQIADLSLILKNTNGLLLFSGSNTEFKKAHKVFSLCQKKDDIHCEMRSAEHLSRKDYIKESKKNLILVSVSVLSRALYLADTYQFTIGCRSRKKLISQIRGAILQKEIPLLCSHCKIALDDMVDIREDMQSTLKEVCASSSKASIYFKGKGCEACQNTGFSSATMVAEVVRFTPEIISLYEQSEKLLTIEKEFCKNGGEIFSTVFLKKILNGEISPLYYKKICGNLPSTQDILSLL